MTKSFQIKPIADIPFEGTHDLPNTRQTLATKDDVVTDNIDALTKGHLDSGKVWDWHQHDEYDELCIVLQGEGKFYWEEQIADYHPDEVIIIPAGSRHKIEALGSQTSQFYFVRIKV